MRSFPLRLPDGLHERIRGEAFRSGRSMNQVINDYLQAREVLDALEKWAARFGNDGPELRTADSALWDAWMSYTTEIAE